MSKNGENEEQLDTEPGYERFPLLDEGKITSKVPPSLLLKATDAEKEWYATMSILEQRVDLARAHIRTTNLQIRDLNDRVERLRVRIVLLEAIKSRLTSWWGVTLSIAAVAAACYQAYQWLRNLFGK